MYVVCTGTNDERHPRKVLREKAPFDQKVDSHAWCPSCEAKEIAKLDGLDRLPIHWQNEGCGTWCGIDEVDIDQLKLAFHPQDVTCEKCRDAKAKYEALQIEADTRRC